MAAASAGLPGRRWIVAVGLLLAGAVLASLGGLAWYERSQHLERTQERSELLARVLAESATRNIEGAALASATLAELLTRGLQPEGLELRTALQQTLVSLPFLRGIAVLDVQGLVLNSTDPGEIDRVVDVTALQALPAPGRDSLGGVLPARSLLDLVRDAGPRAVPAGVGVLPLVTAVQVASGRQVLILALLNPEAFANFQQVTLNDEQAAAALVSYGGRTIAATTSAGLQPQADLSGLPPFRQFLPRIEQGSWIGPGMRPGLQISAFRLSATRPVLVMVEYSHAAALQDWARGSRNLLVAAAAAMLLIGTMTAVAARSMRAREATRAALDRAQHEVVDRERELNVTIQSLQELVFRTDAAGVVTFVNPRWAALLGADLTVPGGLHLWDLADASERVHVRNMFRQDIGNRVRSGLVTMRDGNGTERTFEMSVLPLMDNGRLQGFAGSATDVSELAAAERHLAQQLQLTEQLMEMTPVPCSVTDAQHRYIRVNRAWEEFTGRRRDDVIGQVAGTHLMRAQHANSGQADAQVLASGEAVRYEDQFRHRDGSLRDVVINKMPLRSPDGSLQGVLSAVIDVTEFRTAERATREARDAAEDASRAKSEFIANISHELRTPLQSIIGFSELGRARSREHQRLAEMFTAIHTGGQRMLSLVNDLLDVSKIESTVGTIHLEKSDLRLLLREVVAEFDPLLAPRHLRIDLQLPEHPLLARVDPLRLQQVVRNVLANALKFSAEDSAITLLAEPKGEEIHLSIADTGPGIPAAELETIFDAFVQSSATKDGSGGTGLGLAICRKIVQAHGGTIRAENRAGGGAVFIIRLPARGILPGGSAPLAA